MVQLSCTIASFYEYFLQILTLKCSLLLLYHYYCYYYCYIVITITISVIIIVLLSVVTVVSLSVFIIYHHYHITKFRGRDFYTVLSDLISQILTGEQEIDSC